MWNRTMRSNAPARGSDAQSPWQPPVPFTTPVNLRAFSGSKIWNLVKNEVDVVLRYDLKTKTQFLEYGNTSYRTGSIPDGVGCRIRR
jgi:hypothetical protein